MLLLSLVLIFVVLYICFGLIVIVFTSIYSAFASKNKKRNEELVQERLDFVPTKSINSSHDIAALFLNEERKIISIVPDFQKKEFLMYTLNFEELLECSILENGKAVQIVTSNICTPLISIPSTSQAQEIYATITSIIYANRSKENSNP